MSAPLKPELELTKRLIRTRFRLPKLSWRSALLNNQQAGISFSFRQTKTRSAGNPNCEGPIVDHNFSVVNKFISYSSCPTKRLICVLILNSRLMPFIAPAPDFDYSGGVILAV